MSDEATEPSAPERVANPLEAAMPATLELANKLRDAFTDTTLQSHAEKLAVDAIHVAHLALIDPEKAAIEAGFIKASLANISAAMHVETNAAVTGWLEEAYEVAASWAQQAVQLALSKAFRGMA